MTDPRAAEPGPPDDGLLDAAPCGYVAFADDGTVRAVNTTLLAILGFGRAELVGRHVEGIMTVGSRIFYQTHLFPVLRLHGRADEIFLTLRSSGGTEVDVLLNALRRERGGEWVTDCAMLRVRERRKFEDALIRARREADTLRAEADARRTEAEAANELLSQQALELELSQQQLIEQATELEHQRAIADNANQAKSAFLAAMSHELRTPLNAIGGYVQLIELGIHGPVTEPQLEALGKVMRSQRHLLRLINEVLNLARIEAGTVEYELRQVTLRELVDAVAPMVEPQLAQRNLRFDIDVPADLTAVADRSKAEQVLLNLLSNAVKFTPSGGRVSITASAGADDATRAWLEVRDTGVGIPTDRLDEVFEPFVQVDVSASRRAEGSGLGLAISRDLARGMGGDLTLESTLGAGSTFRFLLSRVVRGNRAPVE